MKRYVLITAAAAALGLASSGALADTLVTSFAPDTSTAGVWGATDIRPGGTASIVNLTGQGGNLENNQPLGPSAAVITTDNTPLGAAKAEVGVSNNYGTVSSIGSTINLAYSYYKAATAGNAESAPSIKLTFYNAAYAAIPGNDGYVTLVYEPYWNINTGSSTPVPTDTWRTDAINPTQGVFWENGGFGQASGAGGPPLKTIADWITAFDSTSSNAFDAATLVGVQVGLGSNQPSETGYFDKVSINGTAIADTTYDFEAPAAVPLPKSAWGGLALIGGLGLVTGAKRMRRQEA